MMRLRLCCVLAGCLTLLGGCASLVVTDTVPLTQAQLLPPGSEFDIE